MPYKKQKVNHPTKTKIQKLKHPVDQGSRRSKSMRTKVKQYLSKSEIEEIKNKTDQERKKNLDARLVQKIKTLEARAARKYENRSKKRSFFEENSHLSKNPPQKIYKFEKNDGYEKLNPEGLGTILENSIYDESSTNKSLEGQENNDIKRPKKS